jgi:hypothetical protein
MSEKVVPKLTPQNAIPKLPKVPQNRIVHRNDILTPNGLSYKVINERSILVGRRVR